MSLPCTAAAGRWLLAASTCQGERGSSHPADRRPAGSHHPPERGSDSTRHGFRGPRDLPATASAARGEAQGPVRSSLALCAPRPDELLLSASPLGLGFCLGPPTDGFMSSPMPTQCPVSSLAHRLVTTASKPPRCGQRRLLLPHAGLAVCCFLAGPQSLCQGSSQPLERSSRTPPLAWWSSAHRGLLSSLTPSSLERSRPSGVLRVIAVHP